MEPHPAPEPSADRPRVVVIGCGFGGLEAVKALARLRVEVLLLDRTNHHLFQPLLYQVATAGLPAPAISAPIRHTLRPQMRGGRLLVLQAEVRDIDVAGRAVVLDDGSREAYDHLVVAAGATHSYFGRDDWAAHAPGLKTLADAFDIRQRILRAFEQAERCTDLDERAAWLRFVVIGAGPTGVELAGTLVEIARHTLRDEFRRIDSTRAEVWLVEGGPRVLGAFDERLSASAERQLQHLGVQVLTAARVTGIDAAGVDLQRDGRPVPGVSPAAKQMGRLAAANIGARLAGRPTQTFRYRDYGSLATIGRRAAVVELQLPRLGALRFSGLAAWLFWLFAHVYFLIGFRNRLVVMLDWAWNYLTFARGARVVATDPPAQAPADTRPPP